MQYKSGIQSQLYQDLFASFVVGEQYEKLSLNLGQPMDLIYPILIP